MENTCAGVFLQAVGIKLYKERLLDSCFHMDFVKFIRTALSKNSCADDFIFDLKCIFYNWVEFSKSVLGVRNDSGICLHLIFLSCLKIRSRRKQKKAR